MAVYSTLVFKSEILNKIWYEKRSTLMLRLIVDLATFDFTEHIYFFDGKANNIKNLSEFDYSGN